MSPELPFDQLLGKAQETITRLVAHATPLPQRIEALCALRRSVERGIATLTGQLASQSPDEKQPDAKP